jgi:hypothetical protein
MALHHKVVAFGGPQAGSTRQDYQKPNVAVMYTTIEILLKGIEEEGIQKLIGVNEMNIKR